jgi:hypothetical protein
MSIQERIKNLAEGNGWQDAARVNRKSCQSWLRLIHFLAYPNPGSPQTLREMHNLGFACDLAFMRGDEMNFSGYKLASALL